MAPARTSEERVDTKPLAQPLKFEFSGLTAQNRFMKAAMTERLSTWHPTDLSKRGVPTRELINVYRRWGEGGFGLIMTGNIMIELDQLEAAGNPIIPRGSPFSGDRFDAFGRLAEQAKRHGSLLVGQVSHPGRQTPANLQPNPISPSDVRLEKEVMGMSFAQPRPMTHEDMDAVVEGFAHAAEYLHKAGFDGIQLHGAHGYLLAQFLSQTTNKRTDAYGGSLPNRARIITDVTKAIRARVPQDSKFSLGIKVNSVEFQEGGFSPEDCRDLCRLLEEHGFDFVELSGGTYEHLAFSHQSESTKKREAFFLDFADMIVPAVKRTKIYAVGGFRTARGMVEALGGDKGVHGISLARPVTHEFDLPAKMLRGEAYGAVAVGLDEQDFAITNMAAGTQIRLVGRDREPLDMTKEQHLDVFKRSMQKWSEEMMKDEDGWKFGYIDIEGLDLHPYGTPYL